MWVPLVNGAERLGVLGADVRNPPGQGGDSAWDLLHARLRRLAAVSAELVMTKTLYGDTIVRLRRQAEMGLAAEMQWALLPPLTCATADVTVAAALEPAYQVGGDSVDYAVDYGRTHAAIMDGTGHGVVSAQLAALAVAAYRKWPRSPARRARRVTSQA